MEEIKVPEYNQRFADYCKELFRINWGQFFIAQFEYPDGTKHTYLADGAFNDLGGAKVNYCARVVKESLEPLMPAEQLEPLIEELLRCLRGAVCQEYDGPNYHFGIVHQMDFFLDHNEELQEFRNLPKGSTKPHYNYLAERIDRYIYEYRHPKPNPADNAKKDENGNPVDAESLMLMIKGMKIPRRRNSMGCCESFYDPIFVISETFSEEEILSLSKREIDLLIKFGNVMAEGLY